MGTAAAAGTTDVVVIEDRLRSVMSIGGGASFRALRCFNDPKLRHIAGSHGRVDKRTVAMLKGDTMTRKVVAALAKDGLLPLKEVCESFEFFERVRPRVRARTLADMAAGHGLTGLLFALFERQIEFVTLVDTSPSPSHLRILDALCEIAPWLRPKVRWVVGPIREATLALEPGTSIVGIHACGRLTDDCLDAALHCQGNIAVMPCCHSKRATGAPAGLCDALGAGLATDIQRTYRLEAAGYTVRWANIPDTVTPMHRILTGQRSKSSPGYPGSRTAVLEER